MKKFRLLRADEIECRIAQIKDNGLSLLLYKDARCDQNILDECVGEMNWQRKHTRDNANCIVSIWDETKKQWIEKEDTGTESFTEKEKGIASDSFKRACFNWGIGRELYSAPFIWIPAEKCKITKNGQKSSCYDHFDVSKIDYDENEKIVELEIVNQSTKKVVFYLKPNAKPASTKQTPAEKQATKAPAGEDGTILARRHMLQEQLKRTGVSIDAVLAKHNLKTVEELLNNEKLFDETMILFKKYK